MVPRASAAGALLMFGQQTVPGGALFYQKRAVRIAYQEAGSGFPLLRIAGGGLNSRDGRFLSRAPSIRSKSSRDRTVASLQTCATPMAGGESCGPVEIERPWNSQWQISAFRGDLTAGHIANAIRRLSVRFGTSGKAGRGDAAQQFNPGRLFSCKSALPRAFPFCRGLPDPTGRDW